MKTFRIASILALLAGSIFYFSMSVRYHLLAEKVKADARALGSQSTSMNPKAEELNAQTARLNNQMERYNELPKPFAEIMQQILRDSGFTNVNCLVWGERNGKMLGFMINSNDVTTLPGMSVRMIQVDPTETSARKKL